MGCCTSIHQHHAPAASWAFLLEQTSLTSLAIASAAQSATSNSCHALHDLSCAHALLTPSGLAPSKNQSVSQCVSQCVSQWVSQSVSCCSCTTHRSTSSSNAQAAKSPHTHLCLHTSRCYKQLELQQQTRTHCWASHLNNTHRKNQQAQPTPTYTHSKHTTRSRQIADSPLKTSCQHHKAQPSHTCSCDKRLSSQHRQ